MSFDGSARHKATLYLGTLCMRGHDHDGTGQSLRRMRAATGRGPCVACERLTHAPCERSRETSRRWKKRNPQYKNPPTDEKHARTRRWRRRTTVEQVPRELQPERAALYDLASALAHAWKEAKK